MNRLHVRIAVSDAAAWTAQRFFGGRYRVIPNGVELDPLGAPRVRAARTPLRIVFVGQAVERKGLPVLLRAFEALRARVPATLTIIGAGEGEVAPLMLDGRGVEVLGRVDDERKRSALRDADVLCAPSLGGESFGMILTEAFAAGTPVVASDIAGYRDVVEPGVNGLLVPRGDAAALAEVLHELWHEPARVATLARGAHAAAEAYAWPRVAGEVLEAYSDAIATPVATGSRALATRTGLLPADGKPRVPARRLPSPDPAPAGAGRASGALAIVRKAAFVCAAVLGVVLGIGALEQIGVDRVGESLLRSNMPWVLAGLAIMCASMALRAVAWHAILRAALPEARLKLGDALQGTFIGVLMSATLPARLGEPSRALIVARRSGRPRERLPAVLGTLVAQTLLNIVALLILGAVMFATVGLFSGRERTLLFITVAPLAVALAVLVAPVLVRRRRDGSHRINRLVAQARTAAHDMRRGLRVFRIPRLAAQATGAQLAAWALQWLSCYVLLVAMGLDERAGLGAAAAVLFAVNVTAVLPATPSNLGIFQAACVAVLHAYGVNSADALGYGIVLQAVELTTAFIMGMPALLKEGVSWREVKLRALHAAPVQLPERRRGSDALEAEI